MIFIGQCLQVFVLKHHLRMYTCCSHNFWFEKWCLLWFMGGFVFWDACTLFTAVRGKGAFLNGQHIYGQWWSCEPPLMPRCWWLLLWQQHQEILKSWRWVGFMRVSWFCKLCLSPAILLSKLVSFCWGCEASEQQNIGNALLATEVPTASFIGIQFCWFHLREIIEYSNLLIILHCALVGPGSLWLEWCQIVGDKLDV
jgi:hypothetical protein